MIVAIDHGPLCYRCALHTVVQTGPWMPAGGSLVVLVGPSGGGGVVIGVPSAMAAGVRRVPGEAAQSHPTPHTLPAEDADLLRPIGLREISVVRP